VQRHPIICGLCRRLVCALLLALLGLCLGGAAQAASTNEFSNPSASQLPAPSAANTTPSCPLDSNDQFACSPDPLPPADSNNPERYLNSAYWPAEKRPDIEMYAIQVYGYSYQNCSAKLPHYCFLTDALAAGYPVSHTPQVGDLWLAPGECLAWGGPGAPLPTGCTDDANDWYMGYVDAVNSDGSFIQSWGGSTDASDSGLGETWFSGAMNPYTDFIGLMPEGQWPSTVHNTVSVSVDHNGDHVDVTVSSDAPDAKLTLSGPHQLTPALDSSGEASLTLPPGNWTACASSGGVGTSFPPGSGCTSFTLDGSPGLHLSGLHGTGHHRYVTLTVSAAAVGQQASLVLSYRKKTCPKVIGYPGGLCGYTKKTRVAKSVITLRASQRISFQAKLFGRKRAVQVTVHTGKFTLNGVPYRSGSQTRLYLG
jgi:hypothetical protein